MTGSGGRAEGPPDADEVHEMLNCTAQLFPKETELYASTFDSFIHNLLAHPTAAKALPVFEGEIGDTVRPPAARSPGAPVLERAVFSIP